MIQSFEIKNYKCFQNSRLDGLKRLNIIIGANGAGKTALLEALLLGFRASPPVIAFVNQLRGTWAFPAGVGPVTTEMFRHFWDHFFFKLDAGQSISIEIADSTKGKNCLRMFYGEGPKDQIGFGAQPAGIQQIAKPFVFELKNSRGTSSCKVQVNNKGEVIVDQALESPPSAAILGSTLGYGPADNIAWWSQLAQKGEDARIAKMLSGEFPQIEELKLLSPYGPISTAFYAKLKHPNITLSLQDVSAGINKLFTILLTTVFYKNGVVLIDEIENGLYHEKFPKLWSLLRTCAHENDCQIFASTHSQEILEAAAQALKDHSGEVCLIRAEPSTDQTILHRFDGADALGAIEDQIRVR